MPSLLGKVSIKCLAYTMINYQLTFQVDELLHVDYEKLGLTPKIVSRKFLRQFKPKITFYPSQPFNTLCCEGNESTVVKLFFVILSVSFSIENILFHWNRPNLSKFVDFEIPFSIVPDFPFLSVGRDLKPSSLGKYLQYILNKKSKRASWSPVPCT